MRKAILAGVVALLFCSAAFAQHSATLTWTASSDATANPSLTYNVYRATTTTDCSATTTPLLMFIKQNATPVTAITYKDSNVSVGNEYCYQVKSALNSLESVPSNTATAVILPSPPQNLSEETN